MDERLARMALCALAPLGAPALMKLAAVEEPAYLWDALRRSGEANMWSRRAQHIDPEEIQAATVRSGARFIIPGDDEWPQHLEGLQEAQVGDQAGSPIGLWLLGQPLPPMERCVAIVGSRAATPYGQRIAHELAADLASEGYVIVSGLAYGIDACAHQGALVGGAVGTTVAVVASGLDNPYPASNAVLANSISKRGTLVSELPPGHSPRRQAFLARNRIIAGLSSGLCIIEAALRSGAKNSVAWANDLGRTVMAVPGPITSSLSITPHRLIRDGAASLVTSSAEVKELLEPLGTVPGTSNRGSAVAFDRLPEEWQEIREVIPSGGSITTGEVARATGMPMAACLAGLGALLDERWIDQQEDGSWTLPRSKR